MFLLTALPYVNSIRVTIITGSIQITCTNTRQCSSTRPYPEITIANPESYTVIPRLTSDPDNEDFFAVFRTRQQTWTVGPFQELMVVYTYQQVKTSVLASITSYLFRQKRKFITLRSRPTDVWWCTEDIGLLFIAKLWILSLWFVRNSSFSDKVVDRVMQIWYHGQKVLACVLALCKGFSSFLPQNTLCFLSVNVVWGGMLTVHCRTNNGTHKHIVYSDTWANEWPC